MKYALSFFAAFFMALAPLPAQAEDAQIAAGARVYKKCVACHLIGAGATHRIGPHLNNIFTRGIAALSDYRYSKPMQNYAAQNKIWDDATLATYLKSPRTAVPGTRMSFIGLRRDKDIAHVIAYMKTLMKP